MGSRWSGLFISRWALVPQLGNKVSSGGEACLFVFVTQFDAVVGWDEVGAAFFLEGFAGVGPVERMGHGRVGLGDELLELGLPCGHRGDVAAAQALSLEDAEEDFDLVEPRAVFGQVDEADAVSDIREEFTPRGHRLQASARVFFLGASSEPHSWATHCTRLSEACVLRLSTTKIHSAVASRFTVRSRCATNSGSVRIASKGGAMI